MNAIKFSMQKKTYYKLHPRLISFIIHLGLSILFGAVWLLLLPGRYPLYFSHVNWIYNAGGDVLQHQLGWEWFRHEPWRFPLGSILAYGYPHGTTLTFMDSIPLFALPIKVFSPWLEQSFQYFGIWELTAIMGQMLMGMLILHEFTRSYPLKVLGASVLVLSPPMIFRAFYHSSLSAHWLLLAAIWFILLEYRNKLWQGAWIALFALSMLVHLYFIPMLVPLWLISIYFHFTREKNVKALIFNILSVIGSMILVGYGTGIFSLEYKRLVLSGYGTFSWNLNGFFNPFPFSSNYIKEMPATGGQYEGFSYLGLGNILILPAAVYLFVQNEFTPSRRKFILSFIIASLVYTLFALSNRATLNLQPIWDIPLSKPVLDFLCLFRSSGRFIWPVFYFLTLIGVICIIRNVRYAFPVLSLALFLQFSDIQPLYESKKLSGFSDYQSPLQAEFWREAENTNEHIVIIPARINKEFPFEPIALYAAYNQITLNYGYIARSDYGANVRYAEQVWEDLNRGMSDPYTIYILKDTEYIQNAKDKLTDSMLICNIDDYTILLSEDFSKHVPNIDYSQFCNKPLD